MQDQYQKGLAIIQKALHDGLQEHGISDAVVNCDALSSGTHDANFVVTAGGQTQSQRFAREEIEDSGQAIDAPAAIKVRMLVSHFVR
jgi:hypothetical protein